MAKNRVLCAEILDHLPSDDPSALRARIDLRRVNALMGNNRWVRRALLRSIKTKKSTLPGKPRFIEIGAGEGRLCQRIANWFPEVTVTGLDLVTRPSELPKTISWKQGDLFEQLPSCLGEALVGVMILHHFPNESLIQLGRMLRNYQVVCFCEPWRVQFPHFLGALMRPFWGKVTRHDLPASIDAGFVSGELAQLLGLGSWHLEESVDWRGSLRLLGWKE